MMKMLWIDTFIIDLPMKVAPKNTPKGIRKWPQVSPAKSNRGLGIEAHRVTAKKAFFFKVLYSISFMLSMNDRVSALASLSSSSISSNSSCFLPARLAALATK